MTTIVTRTDTLASANASTTVKGSALTHTELDRNFYPIKITTDGTAEASKALILDANKDFTGVRNITITGTLTGALASAATGTTQTAGDNSTKLATTAYVDAQGVGGQGTEWTDVSGSRALGTTYQNTTGAPIMVSITAKIQEQVGFTAYCDSNSTPVTEVAYFYTVSSNANVDNFRITTTFIVPDQHYYKTSSGSAVEVYWVELR